MLTKLSNAQQRICIQMTNNSKLFIGIQEITRERERERERERGKKKSS